MLAPLTSWLTPGSLFLLLNILIGTIFLTSRFTSARRPQPGPEYPPPPLARSPSLLERVKSINFSFHNYNQPNHNTPPDQYTPPPQIERSPSLLDRVRSINLIRYKFTDPNPQNEGPGLGPGFQQPARTRSILQRVKSIDFASFYRSDSIKTNPELESDSDYDPTREPGYAIRIKSEKTVTQRRLPAEEMERNRPGTSRIERTVSIGEGVDVDLKADHFINKFKQQLKLQRLDSLMRYKEMIMGK